ncbi:MAG: hypothetical protein ACK4ND_13920 [Cytophagaceae bacterium]
MKLRNLFKGKKGKQGEKEKKSDQKSDVRENKHSTQVEVQEEGKSQSEKNRKERIKLKEHTMGFPSDVDGTEVDVILEIPEVKVERLRINVEDIDVRVNLFVQAINAITIKAGVHVHLDQVEIEIKGVRAEAYLQIRLERVKQVLVKVMQMLDNNSKTLAEILKPLTKGAGKAVAQIGQ